MRAYRNGSENSWKIEILYIAWFVVLHRAAQHSKLVSLPPTSIPSGTTTTVTIFNEPGPIYLLTCSAAGFLSPCMTKSQAFSLCSPDAQWHNVRKLCTLVLCCRSITARAVYKGRNNLVTAWTSNITSFLLEFVSYIYIRQGKSYQAVQVIWTLQYCEEPVAKAQSLDYSGTHINLIPASLQLQMLLA